MNGKRARALRKVAEQATIGRPDRSMVQLRNGMLINGSSTTRGVYRVLKNAFYATRFETPKHIERIPRVRNKRWRR